MLVLQNAAQTFVDFPGINTTIESVGTGIAKFDLLFSFGERHAPDGTPAGIEGTIEYSSDLFERSTVEAIASRFERLLEAAVTHIDQSIGRLDLLSAEERRQILEEWNDGDSRSHFTGVVRGAGGEESRRDGGGVRREQSQL
jgi:non-ribosomal peptide synthetase component F